MLVNCGQNWIKSMLLQSGFVRGSQQDVGQRSSDRFCSVPASHRQSDEGPGLAARHQQTNYLHRGHSNGTDETFACHSDRDRHFRYSVRHCQPSLVLHQELQGEIAALVLYFQPAAYL